jgi:hypothetical protein
MAPEFSFEFYHSALVLPFDHTLKGSLRFKPLEAVDIRYRDSNRNNRRVPFIHALLPHDQSIFMIPWIEN